MRKVLSKKLLEKLRTANISHHGKIMDLTETRVRLGLAMAKRERHIKKLQKIPFLKTLLHKPFTFKASLGGRQMKYKLLSHGIEAIKGTQARSIFILDPYGRVRMFYKAHPKTKGPDSWEEFRNVVRKTSVNGPVWEYKEIQFMGQKEYREKELIFDAISEHEGQMTFHKEWNPRKAKIALKYL